MVQQLISQWPPEVLMPLLKHAMLFGDAAFPSRPIQNYVTVLCPSMLSGTETAYFITLSSFLVSAGIAEGMGLVVHFLTSGPVLVGEIIAGMVCGPMILDAFPTIADHMQGVGKLAMMVMLFERGLHTNFASITQCGAIGVLIAVTSIGLSMLLVWVAMMKNGQSTIESIIGGCIMSTTIFGLVDVGWRRVQLKDMNKHSTLASKLLDAATTSNTMLIMPVLTVLYNINPEYKTYVPLDQWWVVCQPMLFSLVFIVGAILLRCLFNAFSARMNFSCRECIPPLCWTGSLLESKADPNSELYNKLEIVQLTFMTAFALVMAVAAEVVKVPPLVGFILAGMCFGGSESCRDSWVGNTRNLTHWLSRIFFTCNIGFILPKIMGTPESVLDGFEVASAAFFGSFIAAALGVLPLLMKEKNGASSIFLSGCAMANVGELGFVFLHEFWNAGSLSETSFASLLWGLMLITVISPLSCQVCRHTQDEAEKERERVASYDGDKLQSEKQREILLEHQGMETLDNREKHIAHQGMETKASTLRSALRYNMENKDLHPSAPWAYPEYVTSPHEQYLTIAPQVLEPSPTHAPLGPAASQGSHGTRALHILPPTIQSLPTGELAQQRAEYERQRQLSSRSPGRAARTQGSPSRPDALFSTGDAYAIHQPMSIDRDTADLLLSSRLGAMSVTSPPHSMPPAVQQRNSVLRAPPQGVTTPPQSEFLSVQPHGTVIAGSSDQRFTSIPFTAQMQRAVREPVPSIWKNDD